jgi:hypothetical protein
MDRTVLCVSVSDMVDLLLAFVSTDMICRWRLRVQQSIPSPVQLHDVLRQHPHFQGRQGLRRMLPGTYILNQFIQRSTSDV